jgi:hypothetical protein
MCSRISAWGVGEAPILILFVVFAELEPQAVKNMMLHKIIKTKLNFFISTHSY